MRGTSRWSVAEPGSRRPTRGSAAGRTLRAVALLLSLASTALGSAAGRFALPQQSGSIRGVVTDQDFEVPLAAADVVLLAPSTELRVQTSDQGNYVFSAVPVGKYTLIFSKPGYVRQVRADVVVRAGQLTEVDVALAGEFTELDEFVVEDVLNLGVAAEAELLELRFDSPSLMDSISSDLMSRSGASDAAGALRLVAGASVQDGKFAVVRGLPDRYVSSQLNGTRLPSADEDKRAVELDQFPGPILDSIQVSKTFTPDQQGDASGGAVDVRLKGIPDESVLQFRIQTKQNTQASGRSDFLTYDGGGVSTWGSDDGRRDIQFENLGRNWDGAVGVSRSDAPTDYKWSLSGGSKHQFDSGLKIGGFLSVFYERESSYFDNGRDDSLWVDNPGEPLTPEIIQGTVLDGDFKTSLFDVTQGSESVKWGGLASLGLETEQHALTLSYLHTRATEDTATLAEDTRGKEYYFPGYDPADPSDPGNQEDTVTSAPYIRTETLEYTERGTGTLQLAGRHTFGTGDRLHDSFLTFGAPELEWSYARSSASLTQPDKRQFGSLWHPGYTDPGAPPFTPPFEVPAAYFPFLPAANFNLGNLQRIWKEIDEESNQISLDLEFPFERDGGLRGAFKVGLFDDRVVRDFDQDSFSNFGNAGATFEGSWEEFWSAAFPFENHPITASSTDVDYRGNQDVSAWYSMLDVPLTGALRVTTGARFESTELGIVNSPEEDAVWFPPGATAPVTLNPGDADVRFDQDDVLPSIGVVYQPSEPLTLRAAYSRTVARQTFKEITPILQQEFLGGPVFIGNPELEMSALVNYDVRADYTPFEGSLVSLSLFHKDIENPIEYVQRVATFNFTTPVNYPEGRLSGIELEVRQGLGNFWTDLSGLSLGFNATFIDSKVTLTDEEIEGFNRPDIRAPLTSRDMTNAPEHLYNLYLTYDLPDTGTQVGLFYTIQGDTLIAGAGQSNGNFVPSVYAKEFDTLNFSLAQRFGRHLKLTFQAKNLTNSIIEEVYRSEYIGSDVVNSSYSRGIEYTISLGAEFSL